jgi:hypothetical protein
MEYQPGLPDGLFSNQKYQFGENFQCLRLKNVDICYDHLECFTGIWDILGPFAKLYFSCFGIMHQEKSGNPDHTKNNQYQVTCM